MYDALIDPYLCHLDNVRKVADQQIYDFFKSILPFYLIGKDLIEEQQQKILDEILKRFSSYEITHNKYGESLDYKTQQESKITPSQARLKITKLRSFLIQGSLAKTTEIFYLMAHDFQKRDVSVLEELVKNYGEPNIRLRTDLCARVYKTFEELFHLFELSATDLLNIDMHAKEQSLLKGLALEGPALNFLGTKGINYNSETGSFSAKSRDILTEFVANFNLAGFATKIHKAKAKKNNPFRLEFSSEKKTAAELKEMIESLIKGM